ncbi:CBS domain-containing protein [Actinomadura sp. NAK00032]|uniref:restriction system modified-DNA reader domain-containing protein n=1 Tax=Actinomadura sp. NAK00032 TaxID=2742128 RepID=UPI001C37A036|nr:CBS domain-containing protein [Actinomadura sp. NAK00032]
MSEGANSRSEYLLDGRRVTIPDLIKRGLIEAGTRLRFDRVRLNETHYAEISADGQIVLQNGQIFRSPSRAAVVAAGVSAIDGWHAWVVDSSNRSLDSLRQKLLDEVAAESPAAQPVDGDESGATTIPALQRRHEFLKDARARADSGDPVEITVRDLLALWGAAARGYRISQHIEADLANHGLATVPGFRKVTVDATVKLEGVPEEATDEAAGAESALTEADDSEEAGMVLTVGNLPSALGGVVAVKPEATFEEAITLMLLNDYSQVAVMSGPRKLCGAVTWKSIAQARHASPAASFADAIIEAQVARYDTELIDILQTLEAAEFVFVRDDKDLISGIVTTTDVVRAYGELATPFFLIGELDQALRRVVAKTYSIEDVIKLCDPDSTRRMTSYDDLSMGDYQRVLENPGMWEQLGWPLDRPTLGKRLNELREIRNDVMHFNPDPLPLDAVGKLRNALKLLHEYGD